MVGCAAVRTHIDKSLDANFSALATYAWLPAPVEGEKGYRDPNSEVDQLISDAIDHRFKALGYEKITEGEADFQVAYFVAVEKKKHVIYDTGSYGYSSMFADNVYVHHVEEGSLVIDVMDPKSKKIIWQGSAKTELKKESTPQSRKTLVNQVVRSLLKHFPARPSKK